jgi:hypothetical protein
MMILSGLPPVLCGLGDRPVGPDQHRPLDPVTLAERAALTVRIPPPGDNGGAAQPPPQVHTIVTGGMPGCQITLIAVAAAVIAAIVAVIVDWARAARRH